MLIAAKRGESRMEYYSENKQEKFGLGKRTRRINKGKIVTRNNGSMDDWMQKRKNGHR